jgi:hypothetical protein
MKRIRVRLQEFNPGDQRIWVLETFLLELPEFSYAWRVL